jgi:hypothetical protein
VWPFHGRADSGSIGYYPKIWLSVVGIVVFGALTLAYIYRTSIHERWHVRCSSSDFYRARQGRYMLWTTIGSLVMTAGFIVRIPMHGDPTSIPIYTVQTLVSRP